MTYYHILESGNYHVEPLGVDQSGQTIAAEFYFDYTIRQELMGRYGIFGVTKDLAKEFLSRRFTGFELGRAECVLAPNTDAQSVDLPEISLLIVTGKFLHDDFSLNRWNQLVVSEDVYKVFAARNPDISPWVTELDDDGEKISSLPW